MLNNPSGGKHLCKRADLSVSQNSLTTSPNKHSLPTPTQKADTTTPSPSASPASCSKSISTTPTATLRSGSLPLTKCAKPCNLPVCLTIPPSIVPSLNFHNSRGSSKGDALLQHLQVNEMTVAVDTTGFRNDTASAYYQSRRGNTRRAWHKGGFVVGTESQLIVGMRVGRGPGSDAKWLAPLRAQARRYVVRKGRSARLWLLADAGFDGRDGEWTDVVPPIRRGGRLRAWSRVLRAALVERAKASGL